MEKEMHPTFGNGKICYIEIPATNINLSADFYKKIFGWQIREHDDGTIAFDDTVGQVSGMWVTGCKPATEPGFVISIMVNSVATTLDSIIANGGSIVQKPDMNASEIIARFSDPAGNIMGLYQQEP